MAVSVARKPFAGVNQETMTARQVAVVLVAILITTLDGFDVQAMAFAAPALSKAWHIDKASLGFVLGSSLFGMAGGSLLLSPLGDVFGRRPMVLVGLALMTLGSLETALSGDIWHLVAGRVVTGIGVGVMIPLTTALAAEFATERRRTLAVAGTAVGHAVGGAAGGFTAGFLLAEYNWPAIFLFGTVAGAVLLVIAAVGLPHPKAALIATTPSDAAELESFPKKASQYMAATGEPPQKSGSYRALFSSELVGTTIRLALIYVFLVVAAYYLLSWLPQLVADTGHPPSTASRVTGISGIVGIVSGLAAGLLARRVGPVLLGGITMIGFGIALIVIGLVPPTLPALIVAAGVCTLFLSASTAVFYATMATTFPACARVSGIGFVMGFGRLLSGFGPYIAGVLFSMGLGRGAVSATFAGLAVVAGILLLLGLRNRSPTSVNPVPMA